MRAAIDAMRQSVSEHPDKHDPLVGTALVSNGKVIATSNRGKYGAGDHGEFTLLEKTALRIPAKTTLYVTLEPCTKRGPGKTPCADRIIQAGIRHIVIGIKDPNPEIFGEGERKLREAGCTVEYFDHDLAEEIRYENRHFIKQEEEKAEKIRSAQLGSPDPHENAPVSGATISDFSETAIKEYLDKNKLQFKPNSKELWAHLFKCGFVKETNRPQEFIPTVAGLILFGTSPHSSLPQARIMADAFAGTPENSTSVERSTARKTITGSISSQVEQTLQFYRDNVRRIPVIRGAVTEEVPEYPETVIREAVVNALVHRSYSKSPTVFFRIYRDRIIITSPGLPLDPLKVENFPDQVASIPRNQRIAQAATELGLMDARGFGIKNMTSRLMKHGLTDPSFKALNGSFVLTLYGRALTPFRRRVKADLLNSLTDRQIKIVELAEDKGSIRSEEIVKTFRISKETASRDLGVLLKMRILQRRGIGRATTYHVIREN